MNTNSIEQTQNPQSYLVQLNPEGQVQWISVNPNPIQFYATELWNSLSEKDTAVTYKQALIKTWKLLKYLLFLVSFVFLFTIALIISIWGIGFNLGGEFQKWLDNEGQGRTPEEFVKELLKILLAPIPKIMDWANKYVQKYLPGS